MLILFGVFGNLFAIKSRGESKQESYKANPIISGAFSEGPINNN
jgi:hypothetical protein